MIGIPPPQLPRQEHLLEALVAEADEEALSPRIPSTEPPAELQGYCMSGCGARIDLSKNIDGRCGACIRGRSVRAAICQACGSQRGEHDEDTGHEHLAFEAAASAARRVAPLERAPAPMPLPVPRPPPAAPPPTQKEFPMAKKCSDPEGCSAEASSRGLCGKHYQRILKAERAGAVPKPVQIAPAPRPTKPAVAKQLPLAGMPPAADLPDLGALPQDYLVMCVQEFVRRRDQMLQLSRRLGLSEPSAADDAA